MADMMNMTVTTLDLHTGYEVVGTVCGSSLSQSVGAMSTLGLVSDSTSEDLRKVVAGLQLMTSAYTGIKALTTVVQGLNAAESVHNALLAMKSVLSNPANLGRIALATAAAGAVAGAVGGYLIAQGGRPSGSSRQDPEPAKPVSNTSITVIDGGSGGGRAVGQTVYSILDGSAI